MTDEAMSPLRRRMIEDMTVRKFVEKTQKDYIRHVKELTAFLGRSPGTATAEDLRRYQLHLSDTGVRPPSINSAVSALRFFFCVTVDRADVTKPLTFVAEPRRISCRPEPRGGGSFSRGGTRAEGQGGAQCCLWRRSARFRGRRTEGIGCRLQRMLLRIEQGKGRKDRNAMLSPQLLELLRD